MKKATPLYLMREPDISLIRKSYNIVSMDMIGVG